MNEKSSTPTETLETASMPGATKTIRQLPIALIASNVESNVAPSNHSFSE